VVSWGFFFCKLVFSFSKGNESSLVI
jgi:hypothetical protein